MNNQFQSEFFKDKSDAQGVSKQLRENEALNIVVERIRYDRKVGRWLVVVRPGGNGFEDFDNGYVLAFLTAWKIAAEGAA
jgi:hypothetical protein